MKRQQKNLSCLARPIHSRRVRPGCYGLRQKGAAALLATLILVVIASLGALVVNKAAFNEQKLSGVDLRSKEVYAAAVGVLDFGVSQLEATYFTSSSSFVWADLNGDGQLNNAVPLANFTNANNLPTIDQNVDTYQPSIMYTRISDPVASPLVIEVAATATAVADSHITKTVTMQYLISDVGTSSLWNGPPVVVENCLSGVLGTPDIVTSGIAIGSLNGSGACVDPGNFDVNGNAIPTGDPSIAEDMNGNHLDANGNPDPLTTSLHETFFGTVSPAELKAFSEAEASLSLGTADRTFYYIDAAFTDPSGDTSWNGNAWNDDIGSGTYTMPSGPGVVDHPTVLYFDASVGCPPVNGNVTIWGVVFYAAASCNTTIGAQGGGKAIVYGTVAFSGSLTQYNANTIIYEVDLSNGGGGPKDFKIVTALPGTWIDF